MVVEPETATAPKGTSRSTFIDTFSSAPGTPGGERTGHVFPTINRMRQNMGDADAGAGQPLKKLMVANRGVSIDQGFGLEWSF